MKKLNFFILILIINLLHSFVFAQNDSIVAMTELQRMNYAFGYNIKMKITKEGGLTSLPNQEIQISLNELKHILPTTRKDIRFYMIRFIVAHEFAHQIQYYKFVNDSKFMNDDLISRTLIETQADIMAGLIFFKMSPELLIYIGSHPQLVNDVFKELFTVTYNLGIRENTIGSHPSKRDRMLAVRLGLTNGLSFVYDQWIKSNPNHAIQMGITYPIFKKQMDEQFRFIDLENGENMISWSYRQSKKIINYDRGISTNIILLTDHNKRVNWHTEITNPYVDYKLTYKNIGNRSIDIEMEVFIAHVDRSESNSPETYRKVNVNHYKFSLLPNQSKTIEGKLLWLKNENDMVVDFELRDSDMPRIVYPGLTSDDGIYSCSYSNDSSSQVYQKNIKNLNFKNLKDTNAFKSFFLEILNTCELDYQNFIKGIGEVHLKDSSEITYVSSIQFEDGTLTLVNVNSTRNISSVYTLFPNFYPNSNKIVEKYTNIKNQLNSIDELTKSKIEEGQIGGNLWIKYSNTDYEVNLKTIKNKNDKVYSIMFVIIFY
jgi:hypothetical protein